MKRFALKSIMLASMALVGLSDTANAGTKGGLYDFNAMINAPHPFAGTGAAASAAPMGTVAVAPPAPTLRYVPQPAGLNVPPPVVQPAQRRSAPANRRMVQAAADRAPLATPAELGDSGGLFDRFYISFGGGLDLAEDIGERSAAGNPTTIELDDGYFVAMALGRSFGQNWRAEGELSYRQADYDVAISGGNRTVGNGEQTVTALMVNGYFDLNLGLPLAPFVGAGVGAAFIAGDDLSVGGSRVPGRDATEFAYQGIVGLSYDIGERWHLVLDGRYFGTGDDDVESLSAGFNLRIDL